MIVREIFPTYIENLRFDKKIDITPDFHFDKIPEKVKKGLEQTKDWTKEQVIYPLHYEIVSNIDPERTVYFDSNYAFTIDNKNSHKKDLVNVAIFLNSEFKNLLNFSIIAADGSEEKINISIPPKRKVAQKTEAHLAISFEYSFSYCGKTNTLTNKELDKIIAFVQNDKVESTDKKKLIIDRIANYFRLPIGPINRGYRNVRYLELVSILESLISDLGNDGLTNKFKNSFSTLLHNYYGLDKKLESKALGYIYAIRSSITHAGLIKSDSKEIKNYWNCLSGANDDEKFNTAIDDLEEKFKKIILIYLEKDISFQVVDVIEKK